MKKKVFVFSCCLVFMLAACNRTDRVKVNEVTYSADTHSVYSAYSVPESEQISEPKSDSRTVVELPTEQSVDNGNVNGNGFADVDTGDADNTNLIEPVVPIDELTKNVSVISVSDLPGNKAEGLKKRVFTEPFPERSVYATVTPYGRHFVSTSLNTKHESDYGFGFSAGYRQMFGKIFVAGELSYYDFLFKVDGRNAFLSNLLLLAKSGAKINVTDRIALSAGIGLGLKVGFSALDKTPDFILCFEPVCVSYRIDNSFEAIAGIRITRSDIQSRESEYKAVVHNLIPVFGIEYGI